MYYITVRKLSYFRRMVELLVASLQDCCLELTSSKTKIKTTATYPVTEFGDALSRVECLSGFVRRFSRVTLHKSIWKESFQEI